jgi:hypothetical protein
MLDAETWEVVEKKLQHEGEKVREFYSDLPRPVKELARFLLPWRLQRHVEPPSRVSITRNGGFDSNHLHHPQALRGMPGIFTAS